MSTDTVVNADNIIKVVIADDHEIFRAGFKLTLSRVKTIKLLGEAVDGFDLVRLVKEHRPHVVITDIKMPRKDGISATKEILAQFPHTKIIGLSMFDEEEMVLDMIDAGAKGYLVKNADRKEVIEAIQSVYEGTPYYCTQTSLKLVGMLAQKKNNRLPQSSVVFTEKELEIIELICREYTTKEIGDTLFISARTIDGHRTRILEKMRVKNSVGLVVYAIQNGLFDPEAK